MKRILSEGAAVLLLLSLAGFYHGPELSGAGVQAFVDSSRFFYPVWKWAAGIWRSGLLPLWNPSLGTGQPFFADPQSCSAYPPVPLLYLFLPPVKAFAWLTFLHHFHLILGFYVLARGRALAVVPSVFGATAFGMSLHVVCMPWTPVALFAVSWIPWIFAASDRVWEGRSGAWILLTLSLALQMASGYPVYSYLTMLALVAAAATRWRERRELLAWACRVFPATILAIGLNLSWILPFAEFYRGTDLSAGKYYQPLGFWDLATFLSPFVQGHPLERGYMGPHYWVATYSMGLPTLVLILWGALTGRVKRASLVLFGLFVVLSLGETAGLGWLLKRILPGYSMVIRSGFLISPALLFGALAAAEALQSTGNRILRGKKEMGMAVGVLAFVAVAAWVLGVEDSGRVPRMFAAEAVLAIGAFVLFGAIRESWRRWGAVAALAALLFSLLPGALSLRFLLAPSYYESLPELLPRLTREGRLFHSPALLKRARVLEGRTPEEAYYLSKQWMYPNWPLTFGRDEAVCYNTLQWGPVRNWIDQAFRVSPSFTRKTVDYLGIRYLFGKTTLPGLVPVPAGQFGVDVSENPRALPRWFPVLRAYRADEPAADMERNAESQFEFSRGCFIRDPLKVGPYVTCRVTELERTPNRIVLLAVGAPSAKGPEQGRVLLVSSETAYPGWTFENDWGRRRPLEVVNHAFRGVMLEPGEMHATLVFKPASFRLGLFLSLLGLWAVFAILAWDKFSR